MITKQIIRAADDQGIEFEITGSDWPVPDAGDIIHWTADAKDYTARVKSKIFTYDRREVSVARGGDWGVTITMIVDNVNVMNAAEEAQAAIVA